MNFPKREVRKKKKNGEWVENERLSSHMHTTVISAAKEK